METGPLNKLEMELRIRGFSQRTIDTYAMHNRLFLDFTKKSPDIISEEDIKIYISHLMDQGKKPSSVSLTISALKFMYSILLKKKIFDDIKSPKKEKKIPTVLTKDEIKRLIEAANNPKHKLLIELMYSSGLRVSEAVNLKVDDLDLDDKTGTIRSSKGKKDRNIILSINLIAHLKNYLSTKNESSYIFNIKEKHISTRQAQKIVSESAKKANIRKRVFCHALRSSFATHLLEAGTDIRVIQELLGHSNLSTTERYTKISKEQIKKVKSPFDSLI